MTSLFPEVNDGGLLYQRPPEPELWDGDHACSCAVLGRAAPCSHCTDCPECNCARCEDWHDTAAGETCPTLHPIQEEGHTMTTLPSKIEAAQLTQYGLQFPNGHVKWAAGTISFDAAGDVKMLGQLARVSADKSGDSLDLDEALEDSGGTLSHLVGKLRKIAEDANTDADAYLAGVRVVSRKVLLMVAETETHELPDRSAPMTAQQAHSVGVDPWAPTS